MATSRLPPLTALLATGVIVLLAGCGDTAGPADTADTAPSNSQTPEPGQSSNQGPCLSEGGSATPPDGGPDTTAYLGLTETEAEALAVDQDQTIRVAGRDGECFALTMDYRTDRVNIYVEDGVVTAATIG